MLFSGFFIYSLLAGPLAGGNTVLTEYPSVHGEAVRQNYMSETAEVKIVDNSGEAELYSTVFGFLPYWVNQAWLEYDLVSVLAVFSVDMGASGTITNAHGFPSTFASAMDQAHANGSTVVVTVTNFSGSSIHSILTTGRSTALSTIVNLVATTVVDGVCIDFENVQASDSDSLVTFMEDLRSAMPEAHISICTPVVDWGGAFDYDDLAETCDALMMMCYAFAGSWSTIAGPNAPLTGWGSSPESSSNMAWALCDYVRYAPDVHEKLVVGLPYYGHQWETAGSSPHSAGTSCSTQFYTALADRAELYGAIWDDESLTPWYKFNTDVWNQGWYDDEESLALKYEILTMAGIQGAGIWALGYDGSRTELWDQLEESFGQPPVNDMMTDNLEDCFQLHGPSSYWHPYTEDGQYHTFFYTGSISSGPDVNWVEWNFHLPDSLASYHLEVYIPPTGTASVTYHILQGMTEDSVTVDQSAFSGQWVSLGGPYDSSGGLSVQAGDNTGTQGDRIVMDAVRFTQATGITEHIELLLSTFTLSASPAASFTLCAPDGGLLTIRDIAGRTLVQNNMEPGVTWTWNSNAPSGVYFIGIETSYGFSSRQVVLVR